jgi:serine protein kinase
LKVLQDNPENVQLAHKRLYETIRDFGMDTVDVDCENYRDIFNGDKIRTYDYFEKEFFGMESVINKLMRFLKSAAHKGEESRQVLLLMGPVGAGKSALIEAVKASGANLKKYWAYT